MRIPLTQIPALYLGLHACLSLPKCAPKGRVPELRRSLARRHRISARHRDEAQPSASSQVLLRLTALLDLIENLVNLRRKLKFVLGTRN